MTMDEDALGHTQLEELKKIAPEAGEIIPCGCGLDPKVPNAAVCEGLWGAVGLGLGECIRNVSHDVRY
jgi:hypothetical protein